MTDFGDSEPEDSWHPDDPVPDLLDNLRRRILLLVAASKLGNWTPREELRSKEFDIDLLYVIERIRAGG
jgi:hypothetical protein